MHHVDLHLLESSHNHLYVDVSERGRDIIDYIPGLSSLTIEDIPMIFHSGIGEKTKEIIPNVSLGSFLSVSGVEMVEIAFGLVSTSCGWLEEKIRI